MALALGPCALALALAGCGGGGSRSRTHAHVVTSGPARPSQPTDTVTRGPVHASLRAVNHAPVVGRPWPYSVRVRDAAGRPLAGTVKVEFTFLGQVVGTDRPPVHPLTRGTWHESLTYPPAAAGHQLALQVVVRTGRGSVTLSWPISPRKP